MQGMFLFTTSVELYSERNQCQHTLGRIAVSISLSSARLDRSSGCKSSPFQKRLHDEYSLRCYQDDGFQKAVGDAGLYVDKVLYQCQRNSRPRPPSACQDNSPEPMNAYSRIVESE